MSVELASYLRIKERESFESSTPGTSLSLYRKGWNENHRFHHPPRCDRWRNRHGDLPKKNRWSARKRLTRRLTIHARRPEGRLGLGALSFTWLKQRRVRDALTPR